MKNIYWDGHERRDVIKRRKVYLKEVYTFDRLSVQVTEDPITKESILTPPTLQPGEKEHVLLWHDEMAVHANDCQKAYWGHADDTVIRSKSHGKLMMVSEYITPSTESGRLVMSDAQWAEEMKLPEENRRCRNARRIIYPSNAPGGDEYWNMKQMIEQVSNQLAHLAFD